MFNKDIFKQPQIIGSFILGLSIIISVIFGSYAFLKARSYDNSLSVTGSTKVSVVSDQVKWRGAFSRTVKESKLKEGYTSLSNDLKIVKNFYIQNGISEDKLNISTIFMDRVYKNNDYGEVEYTLRQTIEVQSNEVEKISALAKNIQNVVNMGVFFSTESLEFYYSKLPELRVSLLADAIKDAKARAEQIAKSGGEKVGKLKSASSGVVQIMPSGSLDVSDYGSYDTTSINKDIMLSVKASFTVN